MELHDKKKSSLSTVFIKNSSFFVSYTSYTKTIVYYKNLDHRTDYLKDTTMGRGLETPLCSKRTTETRNKVNTEHPPESQCWPWSALHTHYSRIRTKNFLWWEMPDLWITTHKQQTMLFTLFVHSSSEIICGEHQTSELFWWKLALNFVENPLYQSKVDKIWWNMGKNHWQITFYMLFYSLCFVVSLILHPYLRIVCRVLEKALRKENVCFTCWTPHPSLIGS